MTNSITLKKEGSPTIFLWGDYREKEDIGIYSRTKDPEIYKTYSALIDCIYKIVSSKQVESSDIELFKKTIANKTKLIWEKAGEKIVQFSRYFEEFKMLLDSLSKDKSAAIRLKIIQSHWKDFPPKDQALQILTDGLKDTSRKNRNCTIDRIQLFNLADFLPIIKEVILKETDIEIQDRLQETICLFEQGYFVRNYNEEKVSVTYLMNGLTSFLMNKDELTENLIKRKISEQKHNYQPPRKV